MLVAFKHHPHRAPPLELPVAASRNENDRDSKRSDQNLFQVKPGSLPYSGSLGHSCLVSRDGQSRFIAPAGLVCLRVRACQGASPANAAHLSATWTCTP